MAIGSIDETMVEAIHRLGHVMEPKTIPEWVENAETSHKLAALSVNSAQGVHLEWRKPM